MFQIVASVLLIVFALLASAMFCLALQFWGASKAQVPAVAGLNPSKNARFSYKNTAIALSSGALLVSALVTIGAAQAVDNTPVKLIAVGLIGLAVITCYFRFVATQAARRNALYRVRENDARVRS